MKRSLSPAVPLLALLIVVPARSASAQTKSGEFSVQTFLPAPGSNNFLSVEGVRMDGGLGFTVGVFGNYARNPFIVVGCESASPSCSSAGASQTTRTSVVRDMATVDLLASLSPIKRLQIGLRVPISYVNGQGVDANGAPVSGSLAKLGVGDPQVEGKVRLVGEAKDPYLVGAALDLSFPVGHAFSNQAAGVDEYLGNASPVTVGVRGIFDGRVGPVQLAANLRGVFRESATLGTTKVGPANLEYSAALGFRVSPIFRVMAEGFGSTQFDAGPTNRFETDGAVEVSPLESRIVLRAGGGAGIVQGIGAPQGRAFLGLMYAHEISDTDKDGIADDLDRCPTVREDFDGFEDHDGCPEEDNDGDRIPDDKDRCPNTPETINGFEDADGCPDEVSDKDHDGIPDSVDKCPEAGGPDIIRNPKSPHYGCPDRDHDGAPDFLDKCPDVPEPTDDLWDGSGCPHVRDTDGDGIPDNVDKCPNEPETYNGYQDADGCPDKGPTSVEVSESAISLHDRVEFASNKDKIEGAKSFQVLDAVASILRAHKEVQLVEVQGHTDGAGLAASNRKLSQLRAEAVVRYLVSKGVEPSRLSAKGYGPDKPIADNKTAQGRRQNRRVEILILKRAGKAPAAAPPAPSGATHPTK